MKHKMFSICLLVCFLLTGCQEKVSAPIVATTAPVYQFTAMLCQGTDLEVTQLVTESVSCLHDYTLKVDQVKAAEAAQVIIISGAGLENFLGDLITQDKAIDASEGISLLCEEEHHTEEHDHHHEEDPHIWLSPANAMTMAESICKGLNHRYPEYQSSFQNNLNILLSQLKALQAYGTENLSQLSQREIVTFHDGFSYLAQAFDLDILAAVEEESGSEASAKDLIDLIQTVESHELNAVFTEVNGSPSAAGVISRETGCHVFELDMAMTGDYFSAMYHNIDALKEALE